MASSFLSRLRRTLPPLLHHRRNNHRSLSILSPDSKTPLSSIEKTRAALSLLKSETNPERIIDICRAASLTPESHLDRSAFSLAVTKLAKSNYFEGIRLFLDELKTRPDLVNERFAAHSIVLYGQAGMLTNAIKSFEEINQLGISRSVKSLNALLFSCIIAKNCKEASRIFYEFPKKYGIAPDLVTYNTVIKAFCESGMSNSVYSILAEMDRKRCKPNATSYNTLIAGFYKEDKLGDVEKVLEIMKKNGTHPGVSTYNARIKSLCVLKRAAEAKGLLDEMFKNGMKPNTVTYFELIHGFCKEKKLDEAKKLYKNMVNRGLKPESDCYFTLIYYLCEGGDFDAALQVCKDSMEKNWVPNFSTMKSLVNGLVSIEKVAEAKELVGQVKGKFATKADMWNEIEATLPQ